MFIEWLRAFLIGAGLGIITGMILGIVIKIWKK